MRRFQVLLPNMEFVPVHADEFATEDPEGLNEVTAGELAFFIDDPRDVSRVRLSSVFPKGGWLYCVEVFE